MPTKKQSPLRPSSAAAAPADAGYLEDVYPKSKSPSKKSKSLSKKSKSPSKSSPIIHFGDIYDESMLDEPSHPSAVSAKHKFQHSSEMNMIKDEIHVQNILIKKLESDMKDKCRQVRRYRALMLKDQTVTYKEPVKPYMVGTPLEILEKQKKYISDMREYLVYCRDPNIQKIVDARVTRVIAANRKGGKGKTRHRRHGGFR
jgi:hypothetical protein